MAPKRREKALRQSLLDNEQKSPRASLEDERDSDESDSEQLGSPPNGTRHSTKLGLSIPAARAYGKALLQRPWWQLLRDRAHRRPTRHCLLITFILLTGVLATIIAGALYAVKYRPPVGQSPPWYPTPAGGADAAWADSYAKAAKLVGQMDLVEKVNITTGVGWSNDLCVGNTAYASKVGFPGLCLQDGPLGIRFADHITAFPAGLTTGATWNRTLMYLRGQAIGRENRLKGVNANLGPCMGPLGRAPAGGRNWEGFGSDPVLQGVAANETIRGIQSEGVMATAKHFVGNEQEHFRQSWEWGIPNAISSNIDDRTLHELYMWPFAESIRAGVASIMCSYNMVNNSFACDNSKLMNGLLKDELGFQGFVQSDWLAQRSGVASALAGLDMSMPGDGLFWANADPLWGQKLTAAVLNGSVPVARVDDMVTRIVAAWYQMGQDKWKPAPPLGDGGPNFSSWTEERYGLLHQGSGGGPKARVNKFVDVMGTLDGFHGLLAKAVAAEGTVLVKNEGVLPLSRSGPTGASKTSKYKVAIYGEDAGPGDGANACPDRNCNQGTLMSGWGSGAVEFSYSVTPLKALLATFDQDTVNVTYDLTNTPPPVSLFSDRDLCLVFVTSDGGEGFTSWNGVKGDRNDLNLQKGGDDLIKGVIRACKGDVVVVVHAVGPVVMEEWIDDPKVKAVVLANLPGLESGHALTSVLFGDVDASGRLPYTVGKSLADYGPGAQILYRPNGLVPQQTFDEGLYIDYRHFDREGISPRYEFGFGLSYTTFEYTDLQLDTLQPKSPYAAARPSDAAQPPSYDGKLPPAEDALFPAEIERVSNRIYPYLTATSDAQPGPSGYPYPDGYSTTPHAPSPAGGGPGGNPDLYTAVLRARFRISNTGARKGQDVAQLYVGFPFDERDPAGHTVEFPVRVLRQFDKIDLDAGSTTDVELLLTRKDLSYWCIYRQTWVMPQGVFTIHVGRSSRDLPLQAQW